MRYTAYVEVSLPNAIADKMQSGEIEYRDRWAHLIYIDEQGKEVLVEGKVQEVNYKFADSIVFEDNTPERKLLEWQTMLEEKIKSQCR